jgi:hypothetical protein
MPAPVAIFCYNRTECLQKCIAQLSKNHLAASTPLYFFSDGAKTTQEVKDVEAVRQFIRSVSGFKEITIVEATTNRGLATSIIEGVTKVLEQFEEVIVLEDDLLTTENFLDFMNASLEFYRLSPQVYSISGYTTPINYESDFQYDTYFTKRASSWGWATWRNRWTNIDWQVSNYASFAADQEARKRFNLMGSDLSGMLDRQMAGKINSWAIRWCYHQFRTNTYSVFPLTSKVQNIGFSTQSSNTKAVQSGRFRTVTDSTNRRKFKLNPQPKLDKEIIQQFTRTYSVRTRLKFKLLSYFPAAIAAQIHHFTTPTAKNRIT